ncbi:MAG: S8 family serine peptidase [Bacteroidia bacterium]
MEKIDGRLMILTKMKKWGKMKTYLVGLLIMVSNSLSAQNSWVYFTNKCSENNTLDEQVCEDYLLFLKKQNIEIIGTSKWLNAACVKGNPTFLEQFSFIKSVEILGKYHIQKNQTNEEFSYGHSDWQLGMMRLDSLHKKGFTGKGITIGVFDGGFYRADTVPAFDSLWQQHRIVGYWDFLWDDTTYFWTLDGHGKFVLSILAANWPDSMMGAAPHANYLLARTENVDKELHLEEFAWIKAMEWAADLGVDLIHSSLGYSTFDTLEGDYTYADMDGKTTIITKAAELAWSKGIFITNSAGNEGEKDWHYITAPCDGENVLCVGAVDSNRVHAAFSSYGPSADGRVKPDVVAMGKGVTYIANNFTLKTGGGTSFSGPLVAGLVACLKQAHPEADNVRIRRAIIESCDRFANPDTAYGYGIPDAVKADSLLTLFANVKNMNNARFEVYPNPVGTELKVKSESNLKRIELFDALGSSVLVMNVHGNGVEGIDISLLSDGFYWLQVESSDGELSSGKILKKSN